MLELKQTVKIEKNVRATGGSEIPDWMWRVTRERNTEGSPRF